MSNVLKEKELGRNSVVNKYLTTADRQDEEELRQLESRVKSRKREG
jgi:hypothetical protein